MKLHVYVHNQAVKPAELIAWAMRTQAVQLPAKLTQIMPQDSEALAPVAEPVSPSEKQRAGTPKAWGAAELANLKQYRVAHGTKAAAEHFGISAARIRQLLPTEAKVENLAPTMVNSVFHRIR